jgi:sugar lactone lactonase YvrE
MTAEVAHDERLRLGEGPLWLAEGRLTWVDILGGLVLVGRPDGERVVLEHRYEVGLHVGAAIPIEGGGWLLAAARGFAHLAEDGSVEVLAELEEDGIRLNDAGCDPAGRLWAGSMAYDETPDAGSLFRVDLDGSVTRMLRRRQVSNGIDWSPDGRTVYYADSGHGVIYRAAYDVESGEMGPLAPFFTPEPGQGFPDGLTVDAEGMLWVAFWAGAAVRRIDPSGRIVAEIPTGAPNTTSCALGGDDGRTLFITTASAGMSDEELAAAPRAGRLLAARVDVPGPPARPFRGALPAR